MEEQFFQIYDDKGDPIRGHVFRSPEGSNPVPDDAWANLPEGWTVKQIESAEQAVTKPMPKPVFEVKHG